MKYPGGKGKCYQHLINLMPAHSVYIECHLGGGAVIRHKRPSTRNIGIDVDPRVIAEWRQHLPEHCELVQADAVSFLTGYPFVGSELVYSDPPYVPTTRKRSKIYRHDYEIADHVRLLGFLKELPCMVMISGYDHPLYRQQLEGWRKATFDAMSHVGIRQECVWMNFPGPTSLHDSRFLGDDFRERQSVRRRHQRLFDRFDRMLPVERASVLSELNTRFGGLYERRS